MHTRTLKCTKLNDWLVFTVLERNVHQFTHRRESVQINLKRGEGCVRGGESLVCDQDNQPASSL